MVRKLKNDSIIKTTPVTCVYLSNVFSTSFSFLLFLKENSVYMIVFLKISFYLGVCMYALHVCPGTCGVMLKLWMVVVFLNMGAGK